MIRKSAVNCVCGVEQMQYTFQQVFDECTAQKTMFDTVAMSLVDDVLHGKNGTTVHFHVICLLSYVCCFLNPKDGPQKATLVALLLLVVVISFLRVQKSLRLS